MKDLLSVALFQTDIIWENPEANILKLNEWLTKLRPEVDLIVLPEMFLTGFSMKVASIAQSTNGIGVEWLKKTAIEKKINLIGSIATEDNNCFYNRLYWAKPDGSLEWYDKRHLFRMGNEHQSYSGGKKRLISSIQDCKIMPLVCYDLRFPVWSRNTHLSYDILIYVANWPEARRDAFISLLKARAIENQCYVIAVNRVGKDGNGIPYNGDSLVFDAKGKCLVSSNTEEILYASLSLSELKSFREKFPTYLDADDFELTIE